MPDREYVVRRLGELSAFIRLQFDGLTGTQACELYREWAVAAEQAAEMLKAQEAVRPIRVNGRWIKYYACGACKKQLGSNDSRDSYCRHCGRAVKWE